MPGENTHPGPSLLVISALLATMIAPGPASAQPPQGFTEAWREIRNAFHHRVEEEGIVGSSLWFAHKGRVLASEFNGMADTEQGRPVDKNTIYHWASITKTFTGIAVMQLRDRGLLTLDDPLVHYLPELRKVHNPYGPMESITIRHLLSHSAGFRGPTWPWGGDEPWHPHEPTTWAQLVGMMPYTEILFEPGSRYSYSNPGIIFLGEIIEELTGDDIEVYVDKNILKPLGMYRSYYDRTPFHLLKHRSNNYYVTEGELVANGLDFDTGITTANGGLNAPIPDMVRYLGFLAGPGEGAEAAAPGTGVPYEEVLSRASLEEMWEPLQEVGESVPPGREGAEEPTVLREAMGLTFFILEYGDLRVIGHTGGQKAFVSFFYVDPLTGAAAIAAFNTLGMAEEGEPKPYTRRVLGELRERLFREVFPLFRENR